MKKLIPLILCLLLIACCLFSCGDDSETTTTASPQPGINDVPSATLSAQEIGEYRIVFANDQDQTNLARYANNLHSALSELNSSIKRPLPEWGNGYEKEILIGVTTRDTGDDISSLRYNDYILRYDESNHRIIILSRSEIGVKNAVNMLIQQGIDQAAGTLKVPTGTGLVCHAEYATDTFTIDGIDIREFAVDANGTKVEQSAAKQLIAVIQQSTGYTLTTDTASKTYRIKPVAGDENAPASYTVSRAGNVVSITGTGEDGALIAAKLFVAANCRFNSKDITAGCQKNVSVSLSSPVSYTMSQVADLPAISIHLSLDGGSDANEGTAEAPFATFGAASSMASYYSLRSVVPVNVILHAGDYYIDQSMKFGGPTSPSGTSVSPITYMAMPGESVRFVGGLKINTADMVDAPEEIRDLLIDSDAASHLKMIDLSSYVKSIPEISSQKDSTYFPMEVYMNGVALELARWPNNNTAQITAGQMRDDGYLRTLAAVNAPQIGTDLYSIDGYETTAPYRISRLSVDADIFAHVESWDHSRGDIWIFSYASEEWSDQSMLLSGYDTAKQYLYVRDSVKLNEAGFKTSGSRYFFYNVPEEIDLPGECYFDRANRRVYFYPDENVTDLYISTTTDTMFAVENARYINFKGIDFCFSRGRAFSISYSHNITVEDCRIYALSSNAVNIASSRDITVKNCDIYNTCLGGVNVSRCGTRSTLTNANILIENNYFSETARLKRTYTGSMLISNSCGVTIRHNTITNCPHEVIGIGNTNNIVIEYNEISRAVYDCDDAAAVYWGRDPSTLGYVIRYNYFHDVGNKNTTGHSNSIYADDWATGAEIYGNIFYRAGMGPETTSGSAIYGRTNFEEIYNNCFVQCNTSAYVSWPRSNAGTSMPQQFKRVITSRGLDSSDPGILAKTLQSETDFYIEIPNAAYTGTNWYYKLVAAGFFNTDGSFNEAWRTQYHGTIWEPMWEQYSLENFRYVEQMVLRHVNAWREENGEAAATDYNTLTQVDLKRVMKSGKSVIENIAAELHTWCIKTVGVTNHFYGNLNIDPATEYRATIGTTYYADNTIVMYFDASPINGNIISRDNLTLDSSLLPGDIDLFEEYLDGGELSVPDFRLTEEAKEYVNSHIENILINLEDFDNQHRMGVQGRNISVPDAH